jgi:hypothetical protein
MENDRIQDLIDRPSEGLSIEYKGWIDPVSIEGIAKIVRATIAIRNHGGGYIVIGLKDGTGEPDIENAPIDNKSIKRVFHKDKIQGMITKYSSDPFEVTLHYRQAKGLDYPIFPVIEIPSGIKTPVAAKADLKKGGGTYLIKANSIYVRTLLSNNTPSTSEANWRDYERLIEVCFDNREADIGRFLRRHVGGLSPDLLSQIAAIFSQAIHPKETTEDKLKAYLQESTQRFEGAVKQKEINLPDHGSWEVAMIIDGEVPPYSANTGFLNLLDSANPRYTGWPVWVDSRGFRKEDTRPYVFNGVWEALIVILDSEWGRDIDFHRLDPAGYFYLRRALEDDISIGPRMPEPMTCLEFGLTVVRTAEAIAVGLAFAKAMGCDPEKTQLAFAFQWSKLKGRKLCSWAHPGRYISRHGVAFQNEVTSFVYVPLDTPDSAIAPYVSKVINQLFEVFEGFNLSMSVIEELVQKLIERRRT